MRLRNTALAYYILSIVYYILKSLSMSFICASTMMANNRYMPKYCTTSRKLSFRRLPVRSSKVAKRA